MAFATLITGPERRRRWPEAERVRILSAAFAPGAVVTQVARENEISTGLIYKWRDLVRRRGEVTSFAPVVTASEPLSRGVTDAAAITVELAIDGARVSIAAHATPALVAAALGALR
jgi:transposase